VLPSMVTKSWSLRRSSTRRMPDGSVYPFAAGTGKGRAIAAPEGPRPLCGKSLSLLDGVGRPAVSNYSSVQGSRQFFLLLLADGRGAGSRCAFLVTCGFFRRACAIRRRRLWRLVQACCSCWSSSSAWEFTALSILPAIIAFSIRNSFLSSAKTSTLRCLVLNTHALRDAPAARDRRR
jgi:hypothetical protein